MKKQTPGSNNIAARLKKWRDANELSQREAAEKLGVSQRTLQEWEQARSNPRGLALKALSDLISR
jgi:DNA-binding transcriptional regulator YiaG